MSTPVTPETLTDEELHDLADHGTVRFVADDGSAHFWRISWCNDGTEVLESISERSRERGLAWAYVAHVTGPFGGRVSLDHRLEAKASACRNLRYDAKIARGDLRNGSRVASTPGEQRTARQRVCDVINARKASECTCPPMWPAHDGEVSPNGRHHPKCPQRAGQESR